MTEFTKSKRMMHHSGQCVCGTISFSTRTEPLRITICHCAWCQRRTGSAFGVEVVFNENDIVFAGDTPQIYRHVSDESARWLDRRFCPKCGANLGFTLEAVPGIQTLPAGAFDGSGQFTAKNYQTRHVYIRSRRDWADLSSDVEVFEAHFRS